jgi:cellulose synthase/poly-beta-1,6-N-acetylglucosamine synthase-like glycosyltransferase
MLIYLIFIFSIYFGFLMTCIIGWRKFVSKDTAAVGKISEFTSVIVAVRNEEHSINGLLESLRRQDYPHNNFEIILVDDHSTDRTEQIVHSWISKNSHINTSCIKSTEQGKKRALTEGILKAKGNIILTTDADCYIPSDWMSRMVRSFSAETTMVVGLVKIQPGNSLFSRLQAIEFSSLMGSGVALLSLGFPVMSNGASLAFRKTSFVEVNGYEGNFHIPSGDDEFLMRKLSKKFPGSVKPIHFSSEPVATRAHTSLKEFVNQRLRWAGKWKNNDSIVAKGLAFFILMFQLTIILAFSLLIINEYRVVVSILLGIKFLLEGYFLFYVNRNTSQQFSWTAFLWLQVIYPFYVLIIGTLSQLLDYEWKDRFERS